jgi:glutathione S-transferase
MGREVFCDTALIAKVLARRAPEKALFPENLLAAAEHLAYWADTFLFKVVVAVAFQPKALADNPLFTDEAAAAAFMADRAAFAAGSTGLQMPLEEALNHFDLWLEAFNHQLKRSDFLLGSQPTIADFSVYHCLWFIAERPELVSDLVGYTEVMAWFDRIRAYGHGVVESMSGEEALAIAAAAPALDQQALGKSVTVVPIDYGLQPVRGTEVKVSSLPEGVLVGEKRRGGRRLVGTLPADGVSDGCNLILGSEESKNGSPQTMGPLFPDRMTRMFNLDKSALW